MWRLLIAPSARKNLDKLPELIRQRVRGKLEQLFHNPYLGKKLRGELRGQYAIRVWPYRIIYEIKRTQLIILVLHIDHRQGVYK